MPVVADARVLTPPYPHMSGGSRCQRYPLVSLSVVAKTDDGIGGDRRKAKIAHYSVQGKVAEGADLC